MTPFECDICIFRRLRGHDPNFKKQQDLFLLKLIRRANLDAFWSRACSTVKQNLLKIKMLVEFLSNVNVDGLFISRQPFPMRDHCGYQLAVATLQYSRRPPGDIRNHTHNLILSESYAQPMEIG